MSETQESVFLRTNYPQTYELVLHINGLLKQSENFVFYSDGLRGRGIFYGEYNPRGDKKKFIAPIPLLVIFERKFSSVPNDALSFTGNLVIRTWYEFNLSERIFEVPIPFLSKNLEFRMKDRKDSSMRKGKIITDAKLVLSDDKRLWTCFSGVQRINVPVGSAQIEHRDLIRLENSLYRLISESGVNVNSSTRNLRDASREVVLEYFSN